jgi:hypothetical protein
MDFLGENSDQRKVFEPFSVFPGTSDTDLLFCTVQEDAFAPTGASLGNFAAQVNDDSPSRASSSLENDPLTRRSLKAATNGFV